MKITTPTATAWDADLRDRTSILQHSTRTLQPFPAYRSFRAGEDKMSPARYGDRAYNTKSLISCSFFRVFSARGNDTPIAPDNSTADRELNANLNRPPFQPPRAPRLRVKPLPSPQPGGLPDRSRSVGRSGDLRSVSDWNSTPTRGARTSMAGPFVLRRLPRGQAVWRFTRRPSFI